MVIGIDLTWLRSLNDSGGAFHYATRLTHALVTYTDETIVAIVNSQLVNAFIDINGKSNFKLIISDSPYEFNAIVAAEKLDIIHSPRQDFLNISLLVPMINTLHDLQHFHFPEFFDDEALNYRDKYYRGAAEFSERVIVTYQHVKDDIVKYYGIPSEKIDVCPVGMVEHLPVDSEKFTHVKQKYSLPNRYLFYSAACWRHKNHVGLIRALKVVREIHGINISLVCTGYHHLDYFFQIEQTIKELQLEDSVQFLGYVPDVEMPILLTNATLVVIPTFYEAGSYPLFEAMAYGVPVICSNVTSLPDTIGDRRFVFDPNNVDEMASMISLMLQSPKLMEENRLNSFQKTQSGQWDSAVHAFVSSYKRAVKSFRENRSKLYVEQCVKSYESEICRLQQLLANISDQKNVHCVQSLKKRSLIIDKFLLLIRKVLKSR